MTTDFSFHTEANARNKTEVKCRTKGEGECLSIVVGDVDVSIYHQGDLQFLQQVRAKINSVITEFVANNGKISCRS